MCMPFELQIEILTRLPSKSLMRFKCVSKLWLSLIRSRYFTNRHLTVAPPPRLYMSLVDHLNCDSMEVCQNPGNSVFVSLSPISDTSFDEELTIPGMGGHNMVVLRGLILYMVCRKACIYNPTTRQSLALPAVESNIFAQKGFEKDVHYFLGNVLDNDPVLDKYVLDKYVDYFFGYDPVLDQYKVLCTIAIIPKYFDTVTSEHWVFVLEVGGSWKRIEFNQPHLPLELGECINGVIYYLAVTCIYGYIVVSFDVRSEEFSMIQSPDDVSEFAHSVRFIKYGGKPAILDHRDLVGNGSVELWILEDGGKLSKKSLVLQHCQMHLVENIIGVEVQGTTPNGEVILVPIPLLYPNHILYYDLQKNDLRDVNIISGITEKRYRYKYFKHMGKSESIMHMET